MRALNEIISKNARLAMERADEKAIETGDDRVTQAEVARRMSRRMVRQEGPGRAKRGESFDEKSLYRTLTALLAGERLWRSDYLEAFAHSVGTVPERIVAADYDGAKVPDATHSQLLASALGRRLENGQVRRIIRNLNRELDRPGMFDLVAEIAESLMRADGVREADQAVSKLLYKSADVIDKPARGKRKVE